MEITLENIIIILLCLWVAFENIIAAIPSLQSNSTCQMILSVGRKIIALARGTK